MNLTDDKVLVQQCISELKNQMGYADLSRVSQRDLEHLLEAVEAKTGITLSLSTLKRILNGQFDRLPQTSTLNVLTVFIGYEGWYDFKAKKLTKHAASADTPKELDVPFKKRLLLGALVVIVLLGVATVLTLKTPLFGSKYLDKDVKFLAQQTDAQQIPNSVVFSYDVSTIEGDSFYFQQSWNEKTKVSIKKDNHTLTDIYYEPGYHQAKLMLNNKILKETGAHITAKEWFCYAKEDFTTIKPEYINKGGAAIHDGVLGLTDEALVANGVDFQKNRIYFYTFHPKLFDVEGDNFRYKARLRMRKTKETHCSWMMTEVFCENSFLFFTNTTPGCVSDINAKIGEHYLNGKTSDLSPFGCDLMQWQEIEIHSVDKQVGVYLAGKKVFEQPYSKSLGRIAGIGFASNSLIEVDKVMLEDLQGRVIYANKF